MPHKVLVVGFDGATFDIIRPLVAEGKLPVLARLLKEGASGICRSNIPPVTPSAWTSVFTGKNPGKHGIYDFQEMDPLTYHFRTVRTNEHREKTVWQLLGEAGKRSIIMDVPFTYPPQPLNGLMLTGYGTPRVQGTSFTFPSDFASILPPELQVEVRVALPTHRFDRSQQFIDDWQAVMNGRRKLLDHLIRKEAWDFFMVVFSITDNMAHVFWTSLDPAHPNYYKSEGKRYREAFLHSYEMCDRLLGQLIAQAGTGTTTLVLSDHGFGSVRQPQYVFQRLLEGEFISLQASSSPLPLRAQLSRAAINSYSRFPFLREWVKGLQPGRRKAVKRSLRQAGIMPSPMIVDYARSKVILSNTGLRIWINDEERFRDGTVAVSRKEALLEELTAFLTSDIDSVTGRPIIARTYQGEDLYHGPFAAQGPDLVIEYANSYQPENLTASRNPHVEGGHTLDGIFLAHGPDTQSTQITGASLIDITPTILHLLGQAIPPDMDGRVLTKMFTQRYLSAHPVQAGTKPARHERSLTEQAYTAAEEAEVIEQLRQLGYI